MTSSNARDRVGPDRAVRYSGAVLAGGRSRRFGSDKGRHVFRGKPLLEHALASLQHADDVMVVGSEPPAGSLARGVADLRPGLGPLGGLHAALSAAAHDWVAVTACDMPFVDPTLWPFLLSRAGDARMVIPSSEAGPEPLAAVYHRDLVPLLEERLDRGMRSLHELPRCAPGVVVPWTDVRASFPTAVFLNANRKDDLP